mgnify:FL=1
MIDCLLHDGAGPVWEDDIVSEVNVDEVFATCDINQDGKMEWCSHSYNFHQCSGCKSLVLIPVFIFIL